MNLYFASPSFNRLSSALTYAWKSGLKTGMYYLRSMAAVEAIKYGAGGAGGAQQAGTPRGAGGGTKGGPLHAAAAAAAAATEATPDAEKGADDAERVCKLRRIGGKPEEECIMCSS
jgi:ribonucleoside-diphosphate reductase alpha chain